VFQKYQKYAIPHISRYLVRNAEANIIAQYKQALETAHLSAEHERSGNEIQAIAKDEELRKLRVQILLLEDEVDHLSSQLTGEEEHVDGLQHDLDAANDQLMEMESNSQQLVNDLRIKTRDLDILRVCERLKSRERQPVFDADLCLLGRAFVHV
jgi:chromosome segregation ATPase